MCHAGDSLMKIKFLSFFCIASCPSEINLSGNRILGLGHRPEAIVAHLQFQRRNYLFISPAT